MMRGLGIKETIVPVADDDGLSARFPEAAAQMPGDFRVQIAAAEMARGPDIAATHRDLLARFPDTPSVYAAFARKALYDEVEIGRSEPPAHSRALAYARTMGVAERLDPRNGFFPVMRAAALFAANREADALSAMHRAASCPRWDDYLQDERDGTQALWLAAGMDRGAVGRAAAMLGVRLPHLGGMKQTAARAALAAARLERTGRAADGLAVRTDLLRAGSLIRLQSSSLITALAGGEIDRIALSHPRPAAVSPPGIVGIPSSTGPLSKVLYPSAAEVGRFVAEARRLGRPQVAGLARREMAAADAVRAITADGSQHLPYVERVAPLAAWWLVDLALLANAAWMLVLAGAAALLLRSRRLAARRPLARAVRWGAPLGPLLVATAAGAYAAMQANQWRVVEDDVAPIWLAVAAIVAALALAAGGSALAARGVGAAPVRRAWVSGGVTLAVVVVVAAGLWRMAQAGWGLAGLVCEMVWPVLQCLSGPPPSAAELTMRATAAWWPALLVVLPFSSLLMLSASSVWRRVPLAAGIVHSLYRLAVPVALAALLAYACVVPLTLREEARAHAAIAAASQNEGRYVARALGREWPDERVAATAPVEVAARPDEPCGR